MLGISVTPPRTSSPEISPIPVHHRMGSESSQDHDETEGMDGMDGTNYPSEGFNDISMDTDQVRERGNRILSKLQK